MSEAHTIGFRRRHLPHWTVADRPYFVTFRLKGSLPPSVVCELAREKEEMLVCQPDPERAAALWRQHFLRLDAILDVAAHGHNHLADAACAEIVLQAFAWLEEKKGWQAASLCIMPNHVHAVMRNVQGRNGKLNDDLGVLKGFTARECNRHLGQTGQAFWQDENFDHWLRDDLKVRNAVRYTALNPVKAGLVKHWRDWRWTRVGQAFLPDMEDMRQAGMPDLLSTGMSKEGADTETAHRRSERQMMTHNA